MKRRLLCVAGQLAKEDRFWVYKKPLKATRRQCMQAKRIKSLGRMPHTRTHTLYVYRRLWLELSLVFFTLPWLLLYHCKCSGTHSALGLLFWYNTRQERSKNRLSIFVIFLIFSAHRGKHKQRHARKSKSSCFLYLQLVALCDGSSHIIADK